MKLKPINKRGQVGGLSANIVALGVAAIVLVLMLVIIQEMRESDLVLTNTAACNATDVTNCDEAYVQANATLVGLGTFADFWTIIVLAIIAAVVIGVIFGAFGGLGRVR